MSKAFTKENDDENESDPPENFPTHIKNYVTPTGFAELRDELRHLVSTERPKIVETVRWAAGNGDRSENGDYIYGKKRLREIDRRARYLTKRLESAKIIDPTLQQNLNQVFFGATVTYQQTDGSKKTVKLVGLDEANLTKNKISFVSPLAKALLKSQVGDVIKFHSPAGVEILKVLKIQYGLD